jgi:hypothetical protein
MSHLQVAMIRSIQRFATELTRTPLHDCGHAAAWELVERAGTTEHLLVALGYCAGYADCASPARGTPGMANRGHPVGGREDVRGRPADPRAHRP